MGPWNQNVRSCVYVVFWAPNHKKQKLQVLKREKLMSDPSLKITAYLEGLGTWQVMSNQGSKSIKLGLTWNQFQPILRTTY